MSCLSLRAVCAVELHPCCSSGIWDPGFGGVLEGSWVVISRDIGSPNKVRTRYNHS